MLVAAKAAGQQYRLASPPPPPDPALVCAHGRRHERGSAPERDPCGGLVGMARSLSDRPPHPGVDSAFWTTGSWLVGADRGFRPIDAGDLDALRTWRNAQQHVLRQ